MKAISLWQPWATLMVIGWKQIETRSWATNHTGLLAIHATKTFPREARELLDEEPFAQALCSAGYGSDHVDAAKLPTGAILGVGELLRCSRMAIGNIERLERSNPIEAAFGLYRPGRYAWVFGKITRFAEPIPCKGAQQLWDVRGVAAEQLAERLERAGVDPARAAQLSLGAAA